MTGVTDRGVCQHLIVSKVYAPIAMPPGCPARDIRMTVGACDFDILLKVPVVGAGIGWVAVAACASWRINLVNDLVSGDGVFWIGNIPELFPRSNAPLPVTTGDEGSDEKGTDAQEYGQAFHSNRPGNSQLLICGLLDRESAATQKNALHLTLLHVIFALHLTIPFPQKVWGILTLCYRKNTHIVPPAPDCRFPRPQNNAS